MLVAVTGWLTAAGAIGSGPLEPAEALASLELEPGLAVTLAAAEPEVVDPVAIAFDEFGRMFVAENIGYPLGGVDGAIGMGRVARLEDRDGDGRFETRTTFADGLTFPNGVLPWGGGLFVTCAPDLLFLEDVDGDGRADRSEVVLTGFGLGGSTQLRVNDPTLAPDGWIHLAGGLGGGNVRSLRHPDAPPVDLGRGDLRFDPVSGRIEAIDGRSQYGHTFDAAGRRFICMNRVQVQHVVLPSRHLARNPHLPFARTVEDLPEGRIDDLLRGQNSAARIYPVSSNITTADSHAGTFSAACSVTFWAGGRLPARYDGGVFSCDPTGNLVHWDRLVPNGATFRARRGEGTTEFLRSRDDWFRPVFLADGPDGALYVCDMYRRTIEHPDYLPDEVRRRTDFTSGRDRGRIYRVAAKAGREDREAVGEGEATMGLGKDRPPDALVARLTHPHRWVRESAHRLLLESGASQATDALRRLAGSRGEGRAAAEGAVRALHMLSGIDALPESLLVRALEHPDPDVVVAALQLAGDDAARASDALRQAVAACARHSDSHVRFQAALAIGSLSAVDRIAALVEIAVRCPEDRWTRAAVLSGVSGVEQPFWGALLEEAGRLAAPRDGMAELVHDCGFVAARAASKASDTGDLVDALRPWLDRADADPAFAAWGAAAVTGLEDGSGAKGVDGAVLEGLGNLLRRGGWLHSLLEGGGVSDFARLQAVRVAVALGDPGELAGFLVHAGPEASIDVQQGVVREVVRRANPSALSAIFGKGGGWPELGNAARSAAVAGMVERAECHPVLLDAVENGFVPVSLVQPSERSRLADSQDPEVKRRAAELFASAGGSDRMQVYEQWKKVAAMPGDPSLGRDVFAKLCASCHRLEQIGSNVGPDLYGIRNQTKEAILLHIIVPNREVMDGFQAAVATCRDGRVLSGVLAAETDASLTFRQTFGIEQTLARSDIERIELLPASLMPDGLEAATSHHEMAALLAFLKGEGTADGSK